MNTICSNASRSIGAIKPSFVETDDTINSGLKHLAADVYRLRKAIANYNIANSFNGFTICGEIGDSNQLFAGTQLFIHHNLIQHKTLILFM